MDIYSLLDSVPTTLRIATINYLMDYGKKMSFEVGEVVFREGDPCHQVYIILSGEADVIKGDAFGNSNVIATAQQGSVFGEMGVFLDLHRSGSIVAKTPLSLLALKNDDFLGALQQFPDLTLRLFKSLSIKLDSVNEKLSNLINAMSMVQLGSYILERSNQKKEPQSYDFHAIMKNTELKRRDIVNTLINYNRLAIIDKLQFGEDDNATFATDINKLRHYLQRISLNPAKA
jgi:CRP-like cAMP-binding protein